MTQKYGSGRSKFIGRGLAVNTTNIDATLYTGAVAYDTGDLYYSDGAEWIQIVPPLIRRPSPLAPTNESQKRQIRITGFAAGPGSESKVFQTGIQIEISLNPDFSDPEFVEVISPTASSYSIELENTLGIGLNETFYWRARYVADYDADEDPETPSSVIYSEYSKIFAQTFPATVIETPVNLTLDRAEASRLVLSDYSSPFGFTFDSNLGDRAHFRIYDELLDIVASGVSSNSSFYILDLPLEGNKLYYWNGYYESPELANSDLSQVTLFKLPSANLVMNIDTRLAQNEADTTFRLYLSADTSATDGSYNVLIDWGDGTANSVNNSFQSVPPSSAIVHTYSIPGQYTIEVSGKARYFGIPDTTPPESQRMISNVQTFGTGLGLRDLRLAFYGANNLVDVPSYLPPSVVSLWETFRGSTSINTPAIGNWDISSVTNLIGTFRGATKFDQNLDRWNTTNVTRMDSLFNGAISFNGNVSTWNTNNVTNFSSTFQNARSFQKDITNWNTSKAGTMAYMFAGTTYNGNISIWDTSTVTNMQGMFESANSFNQDLNRWNTSKVTNMSYMFNGAGIFNGNISNWDTTSVTTFAYTFNNARAFNCDLSSWNTANVNTLLGTFRNARAFNGNVSYWNTSSVTDMRNTFEDAVTFNKSLFWDTSKVTSTSFMFVRASAFNSNISTWNTSNVVTMDGMFYNASEFNIDISNWNTSKVTNLSQTFFGAAKFNGNVSGWDTSKVTNMFGTFQNATAFNNVLSTWNTANVTNMGSMFNSAVSFNQDISNWNTSKVTRFDSLFFRALAFNGNVSTWDTSRVTNMGATFYDAPQFTGNVSYWNTSNVVTMASMFSSVDGTGRNSKFNGNLHLWDTSKVTNMRDMFRNTLNFNGNVSTWNTSNVTNMGVMFYNANSFNQDLSNWNTSKVTAMDYMFWSARSFNGNVSTWDTSNVTNMPYMFGYSKINRNLSAWNTGNVVNMSYMFSNALDFNGNVSTWDTSKVTNYVNMFDNARAFNQDISKWKLNITSPVAIQATAMFSAPAGTGFGNTNYSRLLTSWANQVANNGVLPKNVIFTNQNGRFYTNAEFVDLGGPFTSATAGRAYLTTSERDGGPNWVISRDALSSI